MGQSHTKNKKSRQRLLEMLKKVIRKNYEDTVMYDIILDYELNKISQQNKIQIPFIMHYIKKSVKNMKLLDIGCGTGGATVAWAKKGVAATGIEISEESLKVARLRAKAENTNPKFLKTSATKLPFDDESFDIIICDQVLEHIPNFGETLKEIRRVAKKNAIIYIDIPNKFFPKEVHYNLLFAHWLPKKIRTKYITFRKRKELSFPLEHISYFKIKKEIVQSRFKIIATTRDFIKNTLEDKGLRNKTAKALNEVKVPYYLFSPTIQFILRKDL